MLVKATIKEAIAAGYEAVANQEDNKAGAIDTASDKIADAIIDAIKSMTITYSAGLVAPTGAVTGTFECTIS